MADWMPIESAPTGAQGYCWMLLAWGSDDDKKTGFGMRVHDKFFASGVFYRAGCERRYEIREVEVSPTHWMPKPKPPEPTE